MEKINLKGSGLMKKQYVRGYSTDTKQKEKIAIAFLVGICIAAGLITLLTVSLINRNTEEKMILSAKEDIEVVDNVNEDNIEDDDTDTVEASAEAENSEIPKEELIIFQAPCSGSIIKEYSPTVLIYSETLDDWRVHNGIDISSPLGEEVCAVADGTISNTTEDFRYGFTITIDHGNGIKSTYSNLSGTDMVKTGRSVKRGEVISTVGDSSLFETVADTHLHIEITKDGKYDDPLKYFELK
jgi:murein DD-endopeptidase MepM/ murein hydrolase activator NlpD